MTNKKQLKKSHKRYKKIRKKNNKKSNLFLIELLGDLLEGDDHIVVEVGDLLLLHQGERPQEPEVLAL